MTEILSRDMDPFIAREYRVRKTPIVGIVIVHSLIASGDMLEVLPTELLLRSAFASKLIDDVIVQSPEISEMLESEMITPSGLKISSRAQLEGARKSVADGAVSFMGDCTWIAGGALKAADSESVSIGRRQDLLAESTDLLAFGMVDMDEASDVKTDLSLPYIDPSHLEFTDSGLLRFTDDTLEMFKQHSSVHGGCPAHNIKTSMELAPNLMQAGWEIFVRTLVTDDVTVDLTQE